jgi:hypothetical protein
LIRADVEGLSALAATCQRQSGVLGSVEGAPAGGRSFQATAAVVSAVHDEMMASAAMFRARMQSTADDVTIAAHEYALTEANSAGAVSAVNTVEI